MTREGTPARPASRHWRLRVFIATMALVAVGAPAPAQAATTSIVRDWNLYAAEALINTATGTPAGAGLTPPVSIVHLAMVQGAVYDAVNAIARTHRSYAFVPPATPGPVVYTSRSIDAAAATAAHDVLVGLTRPTATGTIEPLLSVDVRARLDLLLATSLAGVDPADPGRAIGAGAAATMLANRAGDGRWGDFRFTPSTAVGKWRPTTPGLNDPFAWMARVRPFTLRSYNHFRTAGPLALTSTEYAAEFNEVKALGSQSSIARTPAQTQTALFYSGNPISMWNEAFRRLAAARGLTAAQEARLFAMLNMSGADTLINCWDDKNHWNFWRPLTAIQEAANDGNPATSPDATWTPLIGNPPYPEHPSGFGCVSSGILHAAKSFFRTNAVRFTVMSTTTAPVTQRTRSYKTLTGPCKDVIDARVYLGIHFRTADEQSVWLGKKVAHYLSRNYFQPLR